MDQLCLRCARRTLSSWRVNTGRAQSGSRSFFASARVNEEKSGSDSVVAQAGTSIGDALGANKSPTAQTQRPLIRRTSDPEKPSPFRRSSSPAPGTLVRRSTPQQDGQSRPSNDRPILRRPATQPGQVLRRASPPGAGQTLNRTRAPGAAGAAGRAPGPRPTGPLLRRPGQGQAQGRQPRQQNAGQKGQKGPDRRRRRAVKQDEDEIDERDLEAQMNDYITKYVDRPANPTEPLPYNPTKLTLDDLKADWPSTPMSASGMTESVVQKIEWLARRLPHGYQSPEQIAEHYLKGNLTRFESEEEKQTVLKLASELSKKTKIEEEDGTLHKHETPRFPIVEDPAFASISSKSGDRGHLLDTSIKGSYEQAQQQKYAFMQSAEKILTNNETYGPMQAQKLLTRVQSLIPQGKAAPQAKRA